MSKLLSGEDVALANKAAEEMDGNQGYTVAIPLDLPGAMALVGALQLALRHPKYNGPSAKYVRTVVDDIIQRVDDAGFLSVATIMRLGNDSANDITDASPSDPSASPTDQ